MVLNADGYCDLIVNANNRATLKRFLIELRANKHSEKTLITKFLYLRDLANTYPKKTFKQIIRNDIGDFIMEKSKINSPNSVTLIKTHIKHFYRWHEGDGEVTPKKVRWLKGGTTNNNELTYSDMFTIKEIMIMAKVSSVRDSCIIVTLFDSGMRSGEFLGLRIKDVIFDNGIVRLNIPKNVSKTYARPVYVIRAVTYLKQYLETHPQKDNKNSRLFQTYKGNALTGTDLINVLRSARDKARLSKHITPHILRHSRATEVCINKTMNEMEMRNLFGWTKNSNMPSYYSHLASQHLENSIRKEAGLEPIEPDKDIMNPIGCPKCGTDNPPTKIFCYSCSEPLGNEFTLASKDDIIALKESQIMDQNKKIDELTKDFYKLAMGFGQLAKFLDIMRKDFDIKDDLSADEADKQLAEIVEYFNSKDSLLQGNY